MELFDTHFVQFGQVLPYLFEQNGRSNLAEEIQFLEFLLIQLCRR